MEVDIFSKIWRAVKSSCWANHGPAWSPSNFHISLEQSYIFRILPPQIGLLYFIGEAKCLSPTSNYPFAYLKIS